MKRIYGVACGLLVASASLAFGADDGAVVIQGKEAPAKAQTQAVNTAAQAAAPAAKTPVAPPKDLPETLKAVKEAKDSKDRENALKKLQETHFYPIPKEVSAQLFKSALDDKDEDVRKAASLAIKNLEDDDAKKFLAGAAVHPKIDETRRKHAAQAIRHVDDPGLIGAIVTMVSYDIRTGTATENVPVRFATISNPAVPINLPIELPDIELRSVSTSLATYAVIALKEIARRDLGGDPKAWEKWFNDWKQVHDVRMAQEAKGK
ncbi:MAG: HEAT repeat domain-containing protein [Planctomycetes bacterium]|nr:HEAT repeat domain-containing protein [Planctomycetota bacterium]